MRARSIAHVTCEFRNPSHAIHVLLDTGLTLRFAMLSSLRSVVMNRPYESLDDDPVHTPRHSSVQLNGKCVRHASHENLSTTRTIMYLPSTIRLHHGFMILAQYSFVGRISLSPFYPPRLLSSVSFVYVSTQCFQWIMKVMTSSQPRVMAMWSRFGICCDGVPM